MTYSKTRKLRKNSDLQVRIELTTLRVLVQTLLPLSYWRLYGEQVGTNLVPRAFPLKNGWCPTHFLKEKPWGRGWVGTSSFCSVKK